MSKPTIWISRKLSDNTQARAARDYEVILNHDDVISSADDIVAMSATVDAIVPCHSEIFDADVVARLADRVKIIANHSVGVDHCDLAAFKARGIVVTNTPDVLSDATAEIAMLLMLGAARRAPEGDQMVRSGNWKTWSPSFMVGTQVSGKRVGIVGMGRVGQVMAQRCRGFGMQVHYHNRSRLPADLEHGAIFHPTIETLLPVSDFCVPALPGNTADHRSDERRTPRPVAHGRNRDQHRARRTDRRKRSRGGNQVRSHCSSRAGLLRDGAWRKPRLCRLPQYFHAAAHRQCDA